MPHAGGSKYRSVNRQAEQYWEGVSLTWLVAPRVVREGRSTRWVLEVTPCRAFVRDGDAASDGRDRDELHKE